MKIKTLNHDDEEVVNAMSPEVTKAMPLLKTLLDSFLVVGVDKPTIWILVIAQRGDKEADTPGYTNSPVAVLSSHTTEVSETILLDIAAGLMKTKEEGSH